MMSEDRMLPYLSTRRFVSPFMEEKTSRKSSAHSLPFN